MYAGTASWLLNNLSIIFAIKIFCLWVVHGHVQKMINSTMHQSFGVLLARTVCSGPSVYTPRSPGSSFSDCSHQCCCGYLPKHSRKTNSWSSSTHLPFSGELLHCRQPRRWIIRHSLKSALSLTSLFTVDIRLGGRGITMYCRQLSMPALLTSMLFHSLPCRITASMDWNGWVVWLVIIVTWLHVLQL